MRCGPSASIRPRASGTIADAARVVYISWLSSYKPQLHAHARRYTTMNCCGPPAKSGPSPRVKQEPDEILPPDSPTWKLPPFPAPALPPLTRQNKVIITCSQFMEEPEEAAKLKRQILNGSGEALSVVFGEMHTTFIVCVVHTKLSSDLFFLRVAFI